MCDYSLAEVSNRLAVKGESLVLHRFLTGSMGMRSARRRLREHLFRSCTAAVCIPPGARLVLEDIPPRLQHQCGVGASEPVIFVQQSFDRRAHRDAIRFSNGKEILLQQLDPGQRVSVVSLDPEDAGVVSEARLVSQEPQPAPI